MEIKKIVVVKKKTMLEGLLVRHSTKSQARFYIKAAGHSYSSYEEAHDVYGRGLEETISHIPKKMRSQVVDREDLANFQFGGDDLVVVVGDPGLFINIAKYVGDQPVISVNPDERRFDDVLATCDVAGFPRVLRTVLEGNVKTEGLTMAEAVLDDGQSMRALNDLFVGRRTHVSARYTVEYGGAREQQSTSGIVVSTGTGSTGWLVSFKTWAEKVSGAKYPYDVPFGRDQARLLFNVREPFPSKVTGTAIVHGVVTKESPLIIKSNMPEEGVIFGDGIEKDYIQFTSGRTATIRPSDNRVYLVRDR
jgi:NAD kinase